LELNVDIPWSVYLAVGLKETENYTFTSLSSRPHWCWRFFCYLSWTKVRHHHRLCGLCGKPIFTV